MKNPFDVVRDFEKALGEYAGAPYVVAVNSCTAALRLALRWEFISTLEPRSVIIPKRTYPSVPMAAIWAGWKVQFTDVEWEGVYPIGGTLVWDCAKRLKRDMHKRVRMECLSFHPQKPLAISTGGGAILHDDAEADRWFRQMRFDGRTEGVPTKDDEYTMIGEHCYMMPPAAAEGLHRLSIYSKRPPVEMPADINEYPDLSQWEVFK